MRQVIIIHAMSQADLARLLRIGLEQAGIRAHELQANSHEQLLDYLNPDPFDPDHPVRIILPERDADDLLAKYDDIETNQIFIWTSPEEPASSETRLRPINLFGWKGDTNAQEFRELLDTLNKIFADMSRFAPAPDGDPFGTDDSFSEPPTAEVESYRPTQPAPAPIPSSAPPKSRVIGFRTLPILIIAALLGVIGYALTG